MTVHIYNTPTPAEHLTKDITSELTPAAGIAGKLRGNVSVDHPVITIEGTWKTGNYVYIPDFARYYFIEPDRDLTTKDMTTISLISDPLMSFSAGILSLPILATRCEQAAVSEGDTGYNSHLPDGLQPVLVNELVQCKEIYRFSWSENFILVTVG